jgi:hypothetical protein
MPQVKIAIKVARPEAAAELVVVRAEALVVEPAEALVVEPAEALVVEPAEALVVEPAEALVVELAEALVEEPAEAEIKREPRETGFFAVVSLSKADVGISAQTLTPHSLAAAATYSAIRSIRERWRSGHRRGRLATEPFF